jgi:hypothetical protein
LLSRNLKARMLTETGPASPVEAAAPAALPNDPPTTPQLEAQSAVQPAPEDWRVYGLGLLLLVVILQLRQLVYFSICTEHLFILFLGLGKRSKHEPPWLSSIRDLLPQEDTLMESHAQIVTISLGLLVVGLMNPTARILALVSVLMAAGRMLLFHQDQPTKERKILVDSVMVLIVAPAMLSLLQSLIETIF